MFKNMPGWLYEPLPYLYAVMGLVALGKLDAWVGKLSGVMLISAGIVVGHLRFIYRRRHRRPKPRDLSWGGNQRLHPPKNLENVRLAKPEPAKQTDAEEEF
ncbi:MAG TPA: hypothetical protein PKH69_12725 [Thiobacillaceae bacterium]|nr:hypothetical protein [Thiobacillaceae bacterium]HNU65389.1 hypothetical protein [Thiobacillaceae bacterium]